MRKGHMQIGASAFWSEGCTAAAVPLCQGLEALVAILVLVLRVLQARQCSVAQQSIWQLADRWRLNRAHLE